MKNLFVISEKSSQLVSEGENLTNLENRIIALCALKTNITQNMGRQHCAATLILILL